MKKFVRTGLIAAVAVLALAGCQKTTETKPAAAAAVTSADQAMFDSALAAAKAEIGKAAKMGGEWRDSGKLLKGAEKMAAEAAKLAAAGKKSEAAAAYAKAVNIANEAKFQGMMGQEQAKMGTDVGNPSYLF